MERKTHTLLEKFVRNSITSQEGKELKDSVAKMSDEELTQTLSDVWENYGTSVTVPDGVSHFMKKLSPAIPISLISYILFSKLRLRLSYRFC